MALLSEIQRLADTVRRIPPSQPSWDTTSLTDEECAALEYLKTYAFIGDVLTPPSEQEILVTLFGGPRHQASGWNLGRLTAVEFDALVYLTCKTGHYKLPPKCIGQTDRDTGEDGGAVPIVLESAGDPALAARDLLVRIDLIRHRAMNPLLHRAYDELHLAITYRDKDPTRLRSAMARGVEVLNSEERNG